VNAVSGHPPARKEGVPPAAPCAAPGGVGEVVRTFLKLGCLSFGGPIAQLGYFRTELVEKRKWVDDTHYADLAALCPFCPASSQVVFALGLQRAGVPGAILASLCFTLPSAALMIGFAYGIASVGDLDTAGWLHGLRLAVVAVVAQAVWAMGRRLCPDRARVSICIAAAAFLLVLPSALAQISVIAVGGSIGWWLYRRDVTTVILPVRPYTPRHHAFGAAALVLFAVLLFVLPALAAATGNRQIAVFDSFFRSGALVFGGGHVVLPLLHAEVVPGWLTCDRFLAGYGGAQAVPGPLFTFAAYLGAAMAPGPHAWINGLWCLVAILVPEWLLIGGALPFWHRLRARSWTRAGLAGANASVVGVLLAALYRPVITEAVRDGLDVAAALIAFGLLERWRAPPWLVVLAMAAAGEWLL
jgi:chromate transporter